MATVEKVQLLNLKKWENEIDTLVRSFIYSLPT